MKEFFTKAFAAELKKQGYEISPRTLEGWRISRNGNNFFLRQQQIAFAYATMHIEFK